MLLVLKTELKTYHCARWIVRESCASTIRTASALVEVNSLEFPTSKKHAITGYKVPEVQEQDEA
jgi:hypothetical protein